MALEEGQSLCVLVRTKTKKKKNRREKTGMFVGSGILATGQLGASFGF